MFLTTPVAYITDDSYNLYFLADESIWKLNASSIKIALDGKYHVAKILSVPGVIKNLAISSDGKYLSFACVLEGAYDLYILSTAGGNPQRVTSIAAKYMEVLEFTVLNNVMECDVLKYKITFASMHESIALETKIYSVNVNISEDTSECVTAEPVKLFNTHISWHTSNAELDIVQTQGYGYAKWRKYHGGNYGQLWMRRKSNLLLENERCELDTPFSKIVDTSWNAIRPCVTTKNLYYLSDIDGIGNIYTIDIGSISDNKMKASKQLTHLKDFYVEQFSVTKCDGSENDKDIKDVIHYAAGGCIYILTLSDGKTHKMPIKLSTYTANLYSRPLLDVGDYKTSMLDSMQDYIINNSGKRLAFIVRGKAFEMTTYNSVAWPVGDCIPVGVSIIKAKVLQMQSKEMECNACDQAQVHEVGGDDCEKTIIAVYPSYSHVLYLGDKMLLVELGTPEHPQRLILLDTEANNRAVLNVIEYDFGYITTIKPSPKSDKLAITNNRSQLLLVDLKDVISSFETASEGICLKNDAEATGKAISDIASDKNNNAIDLESGSTGVKQVVVTVKELISARYHANISFDWSPHGRYLAFTCSLNASLHVNTICVYDVQSDVVKNITDNNHYDTAPRFDSSGKYLFFLSNRNSKPTSDNIRMFLTYGDLYYPYIVLLQDGLIDPFLHLEDTVESDGANAGDVKTVGVEEAGVAVGLDDAEDNEDDEDEEHCKYVGLSYKSILNDGDVGHANDKNGEAILVNASVGTESLSSNTDKVSTVKTVKTCPVDKVIDFDGISSRIMMLPNTHPDYLHIDINGKDILLYSYNDESTGFDIEKYSLETQKTTDFLTNVNDLTLSQDKSRFLYITARTIKIGGVTQADPAWKKSGVVDWSRINLQLKPVDEFKVLFTQAWFISKELYAYTTPKTIDWHYLYNKYQPMAMQVTSRDELNHVILLMQGELETSHSYVYQTGDTKKIQYQSQGYLGARLSYISDCSGIEICAKSDNGSASNSKECKISGYRVDYIYPYQSWSDNPLMHSPLATCKVGDIITHINEQQLTETFTPAMALRNLANKVVRIKVARKNDCTTSENTGNVSNGATVMGCSIKYIKPIATEYSLFYQDWITNNADIVMKASKDIGYIHIPNMSDDGFDKFTKAFFAQYKKKGLIIDLRYNMGGYVHPMILDMLMRKQIGAVHSKYGDETEPYEAFSGKLVFLINGSTASDGDVCAYAVKKHKLGKLIGVRTWGGVVGIMPRYTLLDGGKFANPEFGINLPIDRDCVNTVDNSHFGLSDGFDFSNKTQVENHGVDPDIYVENIPDSKEDTQLLAGIDHMLKIL